MRAAVSARSDTGDVRGCRRTRVDGRAIMLCKFLMKDHDKSSAMIMRFFHGSLCARESKALTDLEQDLDDSCLHRTR